MSKTVSVLVGFLAGAAAGAVTGLLFAPEKGSKTRKKLTKKVKEVSGGFTETIGEQIDFLEKKIKDLKHDADEAIHKVKHPGTKKTTNKTPEVN